MTEGAETLEALALLGELTPRSLDTVAAFGERMSVKAIAAVRAPTIATTSEVVVDDDCTRLVTRMPTNNPISGLDASWISWSTMPPRSPTR